MHKYIAVGLIYCVRVIACFSQVFMRLEKNANNFCPYVL